MAGTDWFGAPVFGAAGDSSDASSPPPDASSAIVPTNGTTEIIPVPEAVEVIQVSSATFLDGFGDGFAVAGQVGSPEAAAILLARAVEQRGAKPKDYDVGYVEGIRERLRTLRVVERGLTTAQICVIIALALAAGVGICWFLTRRRRS